MNKIVVGTKFADQDDIDRALYFHSNSFKGESEEIKLFEKIQQGLSGLQKAGSTTLVTKSDNDRNNAEKAFHRLCILGAVKDYTLNYSNKTFEIEIIAKWISNPVSGGSSIALCGPPGVGKTLLAKSVSTILNIPFAHISLGGQ